MMQKPWFKLFIWTLTIFFFYLTAAVVISIYRPGPTEGEVTRFMHGMMDAMDKSLMGVAMNIKHDGALQSVIALSTSMAIPIIFISILVGFGIRYLQRRNE